MKIVVTFKVDHVVQMKLLVVLVIINEYNRVVGESHKDYGVNRTYGRYFDLIIWVYLNSVELTFFKIFNDLNFLGKLSFQVKRNFCFGGDKDEIGFAIMVKKLNILI